MNGHDHARALRAVAHEAGDLTTPRIARLLHVSVHTVRAWMKPETSRSASPCPAWAPELLAYKCGIDPPEKPPAEVTATPWCAQAPSS